jgi:hypothetical protein
MHKAQEFSLLLVTNLDEDVEIYDLSKDIRYILSSLLLPFSIIH